jgi:hypothetical protein
MVMTISADDQRLAPPGSGGTKGPPSAPPAIPPIIINPFSYHIPAITIDPPVPPPGPPVRPPLRPNIHVA